MPLYATTHTVFILFPMAKTSGIRLLFRFAAAGVCLGVAATALLYDLPVRALLWDEAWWNWFAQASGYSWKEWVTSPVVDQSIVTLIKVMGTIVGGAGLFILFGNVRRAIVWAAFFVLLIQHFLYYKSHFWQIGQLLELSLQTAAPLLLLYWLKLRSGPSSASLSDVHLFKNRFWSVVRVLIVLTFVGHGLYAVGFHPVPANFIMMTQAGVGVNEAAARNLLLFVGVLDFLAAGMLLFPNRKSQLMALLWIIPWAILTSFARLWSYGGLVSPDTLLWQWLPEVVRRLPHILVPVALWRALRADRPQE